MKFLSTSEKRLRQVLNTVILGFILLSSYFIIWNYFNSLKEAENASLARLTGIVNSLAQQINGNMHQFIMDAYPKKGDIASYNQDSNYLEIHNLLLRNYNANMLKTPIYTIVVDSITERCVFGVTSSEIPYFRYDYNSAPARLIENHKIGASISRYQDEFGTWLSAFASIRNSKGDVVAVVQADQKFEEFMETAQSNIIKNMAVSFIVFVILLLMLLRIIEPILKKESNDNEALTISNLRTIEISEQLKIV